MLAPPIPEALSPGASRDPLHRTLVPSLKTHGEGGAFECGHAIHDMERRNEDRWIRMIRFALEKSHQFYQILGSLPKGNWCLVETETERLPQEVEKHI